MPRGVRRKAVDVAVPTTKRDVERPTDRHWMVYDLVRAWVGAGMTSGTPLQIKALDEIYEGAEHVVNRILSNE